MNGKCSVLYRVNKEQTVDAQVLVAKQCEIQHNREVLKCVLDATLFLANQNLSFHGHREDVSAANRGNFFEIADINGKV